MRRARRIQIVALHDSVGPAGTDAALDAIVVTGETRSGADAVNKTRAANGLAALAVIEVDLIGADDRACPAPSADAASTLSQMRDWKMGSTWLRKMEALAFSSKKEKEKKGDPCVDDGVEQKGEGR